MGSAKLVLSICEMVGYHNAAAWPFRDSLTSDTGAQGFEILKGYTWTRVIHVGLCSSIHPSVFQPQVVSGPQPQSHLGSDGVLYLGNQEAPQLLCTLHTASVSSQDFTPLPTSHRGFRTMSSITSSQLVTLCPLKSLFLFFGFVFIFVVLGMEPRALHVPAKHSTTEPRPQSLYSFKWTLFSIAILGSQQN
jgi:hypothetical protein